MSIQSEINRLKQAVSDAFTAIGNKGGTVPSSKVSGNLATAINSIPAGSSVQSKKGTFTTNNSGQATVTNLGFQPDLIYISLTDYWGDEGSACLCFALQYYPSLTCTTIGAGKDGMFEFYATPNSNGFSMEVLDLGWGYDTSEPYATNTTFEYVALKYTQ